MLQPACMMHHACYHPSIMKGFMLACTFAKVGCIPCSIVVMVSLAVSSPHAGSSSAAPEAGPFTAGNTNSNSANRSDPAARASHGAYPPGLEWAPALSPDGRYIMPTQAMLDAFQSGERRTTAPLLIGYLFESHIGIPKSKFICACPKA